mgnify:CR=1 FL=1
MLGKTNDTENEKSIISSDMKIIGKISADGDLVLLGSVVGDIKCNNLSVEDQLNYRLMKLDYEVSLEGREFPDYYMSLNQRGGVQDYYDLGNRLNFNIIFFAQSFNFRVNFSFHV